MRNDYLLSKLLPWRFSQELGLPELQKIQMLLRIECCTIWYICLQSPVIKKNRNPHYKFRVSDLSLANKMFQEIDFCNSVSFFFISRLLWFDWQTTNGRYIMTYQGTISDLEWRLRGFNHIHLLLMNDQCYHETSH